MLKKGKEMTPGNSCNNPLKNKCKSVFWPYGVKQFQELESIILRLWQCLSSQTGISVNVPLCITVFYII